MHTVCPQIPGFFVINNVVSLLNRKFSLNIQYFLPNNKHFIFGGARQKFLMRKDILCTV